MRRLLAGVLLCMCAVKSDADAAQPDRIDIFVTQATTFELGERGRHLQANGTLVIHQLDAMQDIDRQLSRGLPRNPERAKAQVLQHLSNQSTALVEAWSKAARASLRAAELAIDRVPAVVFDGGFVVYGASNLASAWERWRRHSERTP